MGLAIAGGGVIVSDHVDSPPGSVCTHLVATDGRVVAEKTQVEGLLGWVDDGAELRATLDAARAELPAADDVKRVRATGDAVLITIA